MTRPSFLIDVRKQRGGALERDLQSGGLFVPGAQHPLNEQCEVTFRFHDTEQSVRARVVFSDVQGVGLELFVLPPERAALVAKIRSTYEAPLERLGAADQGGGDPELRRELEEELRELERLSPSGGAPDYELGESASAAGTGVGDALDEADDASDGDALEGEATIPGGPRARRGAAGPAHLRVRNLSMAEQLKLAHTGEQQERMLLERLYGKTVWEALLRNPRITAPEVARIARMGALPKPLLELIVGNSSWLGVPEVRRALLGNPRLAPEMIGRVLRLLPRHELKLVPAQLAYPAPVRDVARRMLKEQG
jgi:hypothetical protein